MNRIKKILSHFYWLSSLLMLIDSLVKFIFPEYWNNYANIELPDTILWIAVLEICMVIIFIISDTMLAGYFMIVCYWSIVFGISINSHHFNISPILFLFLFSLAFYWRRESMSFSKTINNEE
jgi:hypothetical protein